MRTFWKSFFLVSMMLVLSSPVYAGDVTATATTKWLSQFVLASGAVAYNKPVVQTDIFILLPRGFYLDLWWSTGMNSNFSSDFGADEIDWNAGWSGTIGKGVTLDVGITYLDLANLFSGKGPVGDVIQPYIGVEKTFSLSEAHNLTPYARLELIVPTRSGISKGVYVHLGLKHAWSVAEYLSLNHRVLFVYDTGAADFDPALIGHYQMNFDWKLTKQLTLTAPQFKFSTPLSSVSDGRKSETVYGFSLSYSF